MVHAYSDRIATTMNADETVACSVHVVQVNFKNEFRRYLIHHEYTLAGLLPVSTLNICTKEEVGNTRSGLYSNPVAKGVSWTMT